MDSPQHYPFINDRIHFIEHPYHATIQDGAFIDDMGVIFRIYPPIHIGQNIVSSVRYSTFETTFRALYIGCHITIYVLSNGIPVITSAS